ncbi:hypothetical protein Rhe02_55140 [Rhizocola hellebori]|uniref:Uncharacterized protein n=1 Tax=Rhizocola hellebori TaxID=1392758 RepID=A0A8J3QD53_9ACTN|nr:hypothetical protein Rhe02_55140 [Rhizocola hellebori]
MYAILVGVTDHEEALAQAAADYRRFLDARQKLGDAIRAADAAGMRQVDILKATDHVWTREQVRRVCLKGGNDE